MPKTSAKVIDKINLEQDNYGSIEIDNREPDVVQIWMLEKTTPLGIETEVNVVQIQRENLTQLINHLISINK